MKMAYQPVGTCSQLIEIDTDDGIINDVRYTGGCHGNLLAIGKLVQGMKISDAIEKLDGIKCGNKRTSCADQLAQALKTIKA